ncbi:DNA cytosine methyltransferase [Serratia plymuthica]|uniref:DNA cytosine methyltransferase n=1 Tax=Serratia plymuthica TaxID=82996 RepID=UPI0019253E62|nr:DNA cytosine methyltransferase [Serratia plymuthica]MBL3526045.1 DNA cytosine methyltransferase [Serratia plymuthica]
MRTIEMCAGAGGQALGLHQAGFEHSVLIEIDEYACATLRHNNEVLSLNWGPVLQDDLRRFAEEDAINYRGNIELVAGGVPCPPFSKAGMQLGQDDERDLFPAALQVVRAVKPIAVMIENVSGLMDKKFESYRDFIKEELASIGYKSEWKLLHASHFGVPQLRPRAILVAIEAPYFDRFSWPEPTTITPITVGEALYDIMAAGGWLGAKRWKDVANTIAPTLVGGSKKHGGPDLGPTRAKRQWQNLGVYAHRVGNDDEIPGPNFNGVLLRDGSIREGFEEMPLLNVRMAARIQGFPDQWSFVGSKTHAYRQVGNAFPPPVAQAVGESIRDVIQAVLKERGDDA